MLILAVAALALFAAAPAAAEPAADEAPAVTEEAKPAAAEAKPEMKRICEKVEVLNSRAPKKVCRMVPARSAAAAEE